MIFELDAGNILLEKEIPISPSLNATTLSDELAKLGGHLLTDFFKSFSGQSLEGTPQKTELVTFAKKISKEEGYFSPHWTAVEMDRKVRAFVAWPGVKAQFLNQQIKIVECKIPNDLKDFVGLNVKSGEMFIKNNCLFLATNQSVRAGEPTCLLLNSVQFPGKAPMAGNSAFQNYFHQNSKLSLSEPIQTE